MINKRALFLEVWCTLISLNLYLFQINFASLKGLKRILFRLKRFLLEALLVPLVVRVPQVGNPCSRTSLLNLSLVIEFRRNVFTNFFFEKLSNDLYEQSNSTLWGAINEINCLSDVGSCDSFLSKFFDRIFHLMFLIILSNWIGHAFATFKCSSDRNIWPPGWKCRKEELLNHY